MAIRLSTMREVMDRIVRLFPVLLVALLAVPVLAQPRPRGEIGIYLAEGYMGGEEGTYGKGAAQGVSFVIRPF